MPVDAPLNGVEVAGKRAALSTCGEGRTMAEHRAQCPCGQLSVSCNGDPLRISVCHCLACKRNTGSAFSFGATFREQDVRVEGEERTWVRVGDEGSHITKHFCPNCGTAVYGTNDHLPGLVRVAAGCFANLDFPGPPVVSVYHESRKHPWLELRCEPLELNG